MKTSSAMQQLGVRLLTWFIVLIALTFVVAIVTPADAADPRTYVWQPSSDPKHDAFAFKREVDERVARLDRPLAQPAPITKFYSESGESQRAFAKRVSREMQLWSRRNGYASCGWIATDGERFGLILMTVQRRAACSANQHPMEMDLTPYLLTAKG